MSLSNYADLTRTAFVFAGGGSFGAIQVGMMHSLASHGVAADMVVGSSVGALNGAYYAGNPTLKGVLQLETIWRGLQRHDVFHGSSKSRCTAKGRIGAMARGFVASRLIRRPGPGLPS